MKKIEPFWTINPASVNNFYDEDFGAFLNEETLIVDDDAKKMNVETIEKIIEATAPPKVCVKPVLKEESTDPYANILKDVQL